MKKDGGPAFPSHGTMGEVCEHGMSLRDYFAAAALQGLLANTSGTEVFDRVQSAYYLADSMIAEREKE